MNKPDYIAVPMRTMRRLLNELERMKTQVSAAIACWHQVTQQDLLTPEVKERENGLYQTPQNVPYSGKLRGTSAKPRAADIVEVPDPDTGAGTADNPDSGGNPRTNADAARPKASAAPKNG